VKRRPLGLWLLLAFTAVAALRAAACTRRAEPEGPGERTPTQPPAYTPLPRPPTPTFIPGYITPIPELPG